jgi:hypothetical protein
MQVGESGFTVPWAMRVDRDRKCWLRAGCLVEAASGGTVRMHVRREEDGYHAWFVEDFRYTLDDLQSSVEFVPVVELHRGDV